MKSLVLILVGFFAVQSQADQYMPLKHYNCFGVRDSYLMLVTVNLNNVDNKILIQKNVADVDHNYKGVKDMRFVYEDSDEGSTDVIIERAVVQGAPKGMMSIETRGEQYARTSYNCYLKL